MYLSAYESKPGAARAPQPGFIPLAFITAVAAALSGTATGMRCRGRSTGSLPAIPAYDLRALYDHGSGELSPRFDHRFPSFEVTFAIEPEWLSCCRQTHLAVEA